MHQGRKPPDLEIPDLVVQSAAPRLSQRKPIVASEKPLELDRFATAQPTNPDDPPTLGALDLDFTLDADATAIELSAAPRMRQPAAVPTAEWPTGATPDASRIDLSPEQARFTAYPEPPTNLLETPTYAWLVYRAQMRTQRELEHKRAQLARAEVDRDQALAQWIDRMRPNLATDDRFIRLLEPVAAKETALQRGMIDLDRVRTDVVQIEQRIGSTQTELRDQIECVTADCKVLESALGDLERALAREQAKRKRIDIDARVQGNTDPDLAALSQHMAAADAAIQLAQGQLEQGRSKLAAATRARDTKLLELRQLEDESRRTEQKAHQAEQVAREGVAAVERSLEQLKADLGRTVLGLRDARTVDPGTLEVLANHDRAVARLLTVTVGLERALRDFDRSAVKRGIWLVLATIGLGLILLIVVIVV